MIKPPTHQTKRHCGIRQALTSQYSSETVDVQHARDQGRHLEASGKLSEFIVASNSNRAIRDVAEVGFLTTANAALRQSTAKDHITTLRRVNPAKVTTLQCSHESEKQAIYQTKSEPAARILQDPQEVASRTKSQAKADRSEIDKGYQFLFDSNLLPVWIVDPEDFSIIAVNRAMADRIGFSEEELLSKAVTDLVSHDEAKAWRSGITGRGNAPVSRTWKHLTKSGGLLYMEVRSHTINVKGRSAQLIVANDVTARVIAEEEKVRLHSLVERSETDWRSTFDAITSPLLIVNTQGRIERVNAAAIKLSDKDHRYLLGQNLKSLSNGEPLNSLAKLVEQVSVTQPFQSSQVRDEVSGTVWGLTANLIREFGKTGEHVVLLARDVTRIVELEASLRQNERMSMMGTLVAGVAHEVKNPLFGIGSTLDALELRLGHQNSYQRHVQVLRQELDRLNQLISELFELGKPSSQQLYHGAIEQIAAQAISHCEPIARQHGVSIHNLIDRELPSVKMDRRRMIQVFLNLIENAIHHSPTGSHVTIEARELLCGGEKWVSCSVMDSGPGIAPSDLDRIFEPFFTRRRKGTGLGLSIVHRIVEEHQGKIEAGNRPNGGAVFTVMFRASEA
jgi:PAS domain S-box-containing protein